MNAKEREEMQQMVRETVDYIFDRMGVDLSSKERVASFRDDLQFLRRQRRGSELIKDVTIKTCIGAVAMGFCWAVVEGVKVWLRLKQ